MGDTLQVSSKQIQLAGNPTNSNGRYVHLPFHGGCSQGLLRIFWIYNKIIIYIYIYIYVSMSTSFSRLCSSIPSDGGPIVLHPHHFVGAIHNGLTRPLFFFCEEAISNSVCVDVRLHVFGITPIFKSPLI